MPTETEMRHQHMLQALHNMRQSLINHDYPAFEYWLALLNALNEAAKNESRTPAHTAAHGCAENVD